MKKNSIHSLLRLALIFAGAMAVMVFLPSCEEDEEPIPDNPVASFQYQVSEDNHLSVSFTNFSLNATSYSWNFGDGNSSAEENPTHIYAEDGNYTVVLTATNSVGANHTFTEVITLEDPFEALARIAGSDQKTWKLFREGVALGVGSGPDAPRIHWSLSNDGSRPCVFYHEFTFRRDGSFVFDDNGVFFGEGVMFGGTELAGVCFEATAANMVGSEGRDLSPLLGGTHQFEFDPNTNMVTLLGRGAWMGMPQMTSTEESPELVDSKSFKVVVEEKQGYDLMTVSYHYEDIDLYWDFTYVHYYDESLEPPVVEEEEPVDDLPAYAPEAFFNTFASEDPADVQYLIPTESDVTLTIGVDDPTDADAPKVGQYQRGTNPFADLKFKMDFNILFENFTEFSIDVYVPSSNDYDGGLNKSIMVWLADAHTTENFWASWVQFLVPDDEVVEDEWVTYTFKLDEPSEGSVGNALDREDLDLVGMTIGGGNHGTDAVFYIRNFIFK